MIDQQGFAPAGLKTTLSHTRAPHGAPVAAKTPTTTGTLAQGGVIAGRAANKEDLALDRTLAKAEKVRSVANLPFMMMMPAMVGIGLGKLTGWARLDRTSVVLGGTGDALMNGMRKTTMNKPLHFAADMVGIVADKAAERSGAASWAKSLGARSATMHASADALGSKISAAAAPLLKPVAEGLEKVGLSKITNKSLGYIGRLPLGAGVATVAATAGIGVVWLTRAKQSAAGKHALDDLKKQLGDHHPLVESASKLYSKQQTQTIFSSVLSSAGEALFIPFEANPHMAGPAMMGMMGAQFALPSIGELLVSENPVLNAWAKLDIAQTPQEKEFCYRMIIGSMPQAMAHGGQFNRGAAAEAAQLVKDGATKEQFIEILKDPAKFEALAAKVAPTLKAAEAKAAVTVPHAANDDKALHPANDGNAPTITMPKPHALPTMHEVPKAVIDKASVANDGVLQARHHAHAHG